ncbi:hypothetical protein Hanom_Chr01g00012701 [Helianthus anomalus]
MITGWIQVSRTARGKALHVEFKGLTTPLNALLIIRVKCHFSVCGLGYFVSLVQRFHFSHVGPKRFHRCHFSPLS